MNEFPGLEVRWIQLARAQVRANLEELEGRFRSAVNWRQQFQRNPWLGIGLAAGAGFLPRLVAPPYSERRRLSE